MADFKSLLKQIVGQPMVTVFWTYGDRQINQKLVSMPLPDHSHWIIEVTKVF